ncbi:methyltransferase domain-containing protein [Mesorhizobium japonicum]|uniref:class I SAM-dependent methyltransferase n=1 Tax=Mesorhizobium japonicum TaxID=2066070 RepID=UPI003B5CCF27
MKWALKIVGKLFLSRLPIDYSIWRSVGIFRNGGMNQVEYALKIFSLHAERCFPNGFLPGVTMLELGPGDSIASAVIANAYGAKKTYLVDVGNYAVKDIAFYKTLTEWLNKQNIRRALNIDAITSFSSLVNKCHATYLTRGLESLREVPDSSVDMIWSHSVLEHIRAFELEDVLLELNRILKPGGFFSHNIDYQDHLQGALNNLRFSSRIWESDIFAKSGFYTNRIPAVIMHDLLRRSGTTVLKEEFGRWPKMPINRKWLAKEFKIYSDEILLNRTSHILGVKNV